jgi:hypothetical protein
MFLRQLPHLMERQGRSCVLAFLDIVKAYDTIDRDFLVEAMQAMGAGAGLIGWVQLILRNTASRAVGNGFPCVGTRSDQGRGEARLPAGTPAVPFCGASAAVLATAPRGGIRLWEHDQELITTAVQFADDTEVVLGGMADVGPFLECMHEYVCPGLGPTA